MQGIRSNLGYILSSLSHYKNSQYRCNSNIWYTVTCQDEYYNLINGLCINPLTLNENADNSSNNCNHANICNNISENKIEWFSNKILSLLWYQSQIGSSYPNFDPKAQTYRCLDNSLKINCESRYKFLSRNYQDPKKCIPTLKSNIWLHIAVLNQVWYHTKSFVLLSIPHHHVRNIKKRINNQIID